MTGREPSVTQAEWELVVADVKRQGRKLPPLNDDVDGRCPFLIDHQGGGGRCSVYAARPLGCRTFFCERAKGPHGEGVREMPMRALRALPRALDALTVRQGGAHKNDDVGARPIRSWLRSSRTSRR